MKKLLSYRNIAAVLFVFTFLIFVLAQQYTRQNGSRPNNQVVSNTPQISAEKVKIEQPSPAAIMVR